jgi:hypothetical protein
MAAFRARPSQGQVVHDRPLIRTPKGPTVTDEPPRPPQSPSMARRLVVPRGHAIGQASIVLIVVLALAGAFGQAQGGTETGTDEISVSVEYPMRVRYKTLATLELTIEAADRPVEDVSVAIDSAYLDAFSEVTFLPEAAAASRLRTVIPVGDIGAHEDRVVSGELRAERYWLHQGWIEVSAGEEPMTRLQLSTLVLP